LVCHARLRRPPSRSAPRARRCRCGLPTGQPVPVWQGTGTVMVRTVISYTESRAGGL